MRHISQKTIEGFIGDSLDKTELRRVLDHLDVCEACYDETEVYYMIMIGLMDQDMSGQASADLRSDFKVFLENKRKAVASEERRKDRISYLITALIMAGLVVLYYLVA